MSSIVAVPRRRVGFSLSLVAYAAIHAGAFGVFFTSGSLQSGLSILAVTYIARIIGLGAGYHRYFAHRAYQTSRPMQLLLALLGLTALQRGPLWWADTHRRHHARADTPEDLHSPSFHGFWYAHWGWFFDPAHCETQLENVRDLARDPELRWLDTPLASRLVMLLYGGALFAGFGWHGIAWGFCLSTVCAWHTTHWIQSMSHAAGGYRHFPAEDSSRNHWLLGIVSLGEYHANHHYRPASANQGYRWWELDVTYWLLRGLGAVGLVWNVRDSLSEPARLHGRRTRAVRATP